MISKKASGLICVLKLSAALAGVPGLVVTLSCDLGGGEGWGEDCQLLVPFLARFACSIPRQAVGRGQQVNFPSHIHVPLSLKSINTKAKDCSLGMHYVTLHHLCMAWRSIKLYHFSTSSVEEVDKNFSFH